MFTCIILHNTIIRDELDCDLESLLEPHNGVSLKRNLTFLTFIQGAKKLQNIEIYHMLHAYLMERQWVLKGNNSFELNA